MTETTEKKDWRTAEREQREAEVQAWMAYTRAEQEATVACIRLDEEFMAANPQHEGEGDLRYGARIRALIVDDPRYPELLAQVNAALEHYERVKRAFWPEDE